MPLTEFVLIKNKYCLAYFGTSKEFLETLLETRKQMEKTFPNIEIWLGVNDSLFSEAYEKTIPKSKITKNQFCHFREINANCKLF